jgi:hypothetical protein
MAGTEHVISMDSRKEAGETSGGHHHAVNVHVNSSYTSFEEEKFKKLKEARVKRQNQVATKPKIRKVVLVHFNK